ncbi:MAG: hypothetical protein GX046_07340 [Tissierellia bacterium]|jgi:cell division protein FtsB|nr:hypothetical protein [Tissierellia bacterium]
MKNALRRKRSIMIIALLLILLGLYTYIYQQMEMKKLKDDRVSLQLEVQRLELLKANLEEELRRSGSLAYIEDVARGQLRMIMPDEMLYVIHD